MLRRGGDSGRTRLCRITVREEKMTRVSRKPLALVTAFAALVLALPTEAIAAGQVSILVCYPSTAVKARDAKPALQDMAKVIEKLAGWKQGTIATSFTTDSKQCRGMLARQKPGFVIASLAVYLDSLGKYDLEPVATPVVEGKSNDQYFLMVKKGTYTSLDQLKGKTLGGPWLGEPEFLKRVVFASRIDPVSFFELKPGRRALRDLRKLKRGKLDAVLLNLPQYNSLKSLSFANQLEAIYRSEPLPQIGVMANMAATDKPTIESMKGALLKLCSEPGGKKLCEMFGMDGFREPDRKALRKVVELWKKG
ncbi:MAG: hypothetical protein D6806_17110 [Deltaproteobacteria bacterium]|nr:MAG: hypothetical protein D6806_17110 [Deltaproteobacteria bacterium]